jgi:chemotaxis response regulator CheB
MGMPDLVNTPLRVAIVSRSVRQRDVLKDILEVNGLEVVPDERIQQNMANGIDTSIADVVLVNLDESDDPGIDVLIDQTSLPILFNDSSSIRKQATAGGRAWGRRLTSKLVELVDSETPKNEQHDMSDEESDLDFDLASPSAELHLVSDLETTDEIEIGEPLDELALVADPGVEEQEHDQDYTPPLTVNEISAAYRSEITQEILIEKEAATRLQKNQAEVVFVLGASIGGPQAVKEFLSTLPHSTRAGFILAQHIGVGFVDLLADQLGRVTALDVQCPKPGQVLKNGQLFVAPVEEEVIFDHNGSVSMRPVEQRSIYSPSIDDVMTEVSRHYGANANAIIFSGMGNDGTVGCREIQSHGGMVWAQTPETCVISSMADSVRAQGLVTMNGTPGELAEYVKQFLKDKGYAS